MIPKQISGTFRLQTDLFYASICQRNGQCIRAKTKQTNQQNQQNQHNRQGKQRNNQGIPKPRNREGVL